MPTKTKIKIADDAALRKVLDSEYEASSQKNYVNLHCCWQHIS